MRTLEIHWFYYIFHPSFPLFGLSFNSVTRLVLSENIFQTFQDLRRFISSFTSLNDLTLNNVNWLSDGFTLSQNSLSCFPRSRNLRLQYLSIFVTPADVRNLMVWLSSTATESSLIITTLRFGPLPFPEEQSSHPPLDAIEVSNFLRKVSRLSHISIGFDYFFHLIGDDICPPWTQLTTLTVHQIHYNNCSKVSSLLGTLQDLGKLQELTLRFHSTSSTSPQMPFANADDYIPWHALDTVLSEDPFQNLRSIYISIRFFSKSSFGDNSEEERQEERRFFPKLFQRINPSGSKFFVFSPYDTCDE
ncbi:hypothetical protein C8Q75DRAFT_499603 [Abortiporus biennis]|nr:hypothetical protein C8Q75DRAFT_499603 [Abortiporus biennis]